MARKIIHDRRQILQFIIGYKRAHDGNSPTLREIMQANNISSSSAMQNILIQLERQGVIIYNNNLGENRSIQVVGGQWTFHG